MHRPSFLSGFWTFSLSQVPSIQNRLFAKDIRRKFSRSFPFLSSLARSSYPVAADSFHFLRLLRLFGNLIACYLEPVISSSYRDKKLAYANNRRSLFVYTHYIPPQCRGHERLRAHLQRRRIRCLSRIPYVLRHKAPPETSVPYPFCDANRFTPEFFLCSKNWDPCMTISRRLYYWDQAVAESASTIPTPLSLLFVLFVLWYWERRRFYMG